MKPTTTQPRRLLIVSNRLPVTAVDTDSGLRYKSSAGGLATGLSSYLESVHQSGSELDHLSVDWLSATIAEAAEDQVKSHLVNELHPGPFSSQRVRLRVSTMDSPRARSGRCSTSLLPMSRTVRLLAELSTRESAVL